MKTRASDSASSLSTNGYGQDMRTVAVVPPSLSSLSSTSNFISPCEPRSSSDPLPPQNFVLII